MTGNVSSFLCMDEDMVISPSRINCQVKKGQGSERGQNLFVNVDCPSRSLHRNFMLMSRVWWFTPITLALEQPRQKGGCGSGTILAHSGLTLKSENSNPDWDGDQLLNCLPSNVRHWVPCPATIIHWARWCTHIILEFQRWRQEGHSQLCVGLKPALGYMRSCLKESRTHPPKGNSRLSGQKAPTCAAALGLLPPVWVIALKVEQHVPWVLWVPGAPVFRPWCQGRKGKGVAAVMREAEARDRRSWG